MLEKEVKEFFFNHKITFIDNPDSSGNIYTNYLFIPVSRSEVDALTYILIVDQLTHMMQIYFSSSSFSNYISNIYSDTHDNMNKRPRAKGLHMNYLIL